MLQIGRAVLAGRRADSDELDRAVVDCARGVGGEVQAPRGDIARDHGVQAGLVDRHAAGLEQGDLGRVHVQADDLVPHIGEAGARNEAHIAGADDGDFHQAAFLARASVRSYTAMTRRATASSVSVDSMMARPLLRRPAASTRAAASVKASSVRSAIAEG